MKRMNLILCAAVLALAPLSASAHEVRIARQFSVRSATRGHRSVVSGLTAIQMPAGPTSRSTGWESSAMNGTAVYAGASRRMMNPPKTSAKK